MENEKALLVVECTDKSDSFSIEDHTRKLDDLCKSICGISHYTLSVVDRSVVVNKHGTMQNYIFKLASEYIRGKDYYKIHVFYTETSREIVEIRHYGLDKGIVKDDMTNYKHVELTKTPLESTISYETIRREYKGHAFSSSDVRQIDMGYDLISKPSPHMLDVLDKFNKLFKEELI